MLSSCTLVVRKTMDTLKDIHQRNCNALEISTNPKKQYYSSLVDETKNNFAYD